MKLRMGLFVDSAIRAAGTAMVVVAAGALAGCETLSLALLGIGGSAAAAR